MQTRALLLALPLVLPMAACIGPKAPVPSGEEDFATYCSACHGSDGKGTGAVAQVLSAPPADLTRLAATNDGVFPKTRVMSKIWGYTARPVAEDGPIMPPFSDLLEGDTVLYDSGDGIPTPTPLRLVQLAEHVEGLQEK